MTREGELLWTPSDAQRGAARMTGFARHAAHRAGRPIDSYDDLLAWSIDDLDEFWSALAQWYGVRWHAKPTATLADARMPGARWFPDGRLSYAEHLLFPPGEVADDAVAVLFAREDGLRRTL